MENKEKSRRTCPRVSTQVHTSFASCLSRFRNPTSIENYSYGCYRQVLARFLQPQSCRTERQRPAQDSYADRALPLELRHRLKPVNGNRRGLISLPSPPIRKVSRAFLKLMVVTNNFIDGTLSSAQWRQRYTLETTHS